MRTKSCDSRFTVYTSASDCPCQFPNGYSFVRSWRGPLTLYLEIMKVPCGGPPITAAIFPILAAYSSTFHVDGSKILCVRPLLIIQL